jgi:hypothetical protein
MFVFSMKKGILVLILAAGFSWCEIAMAVSPQEHLSQRKTPVSPEEERELDATKGTLKGSMDFQFVTLFLAVRDDNPEICKNLQEGSKWCEEEAKSMLRIRYEAEGNCDKIDKAYAQNICKAYQNKACGTLTEKPHRDLCVAFSTDDLNMASNALDAIAGSQLERNDFYRQMGSFFGYKYLHSKTACEKFSKGLKEARASIMCDVLFDSRGSTVVADSILNDFAYFYMAKRHNDPNLCESIQRAEIKKRCLNRQATTLY